MDDGNPNRPFKISCFVGDEVTSLKILRFLTDKLETPHVVSYFINGLPSETCAISIFYPPSSIRYPRFSNVAA